MEVLEELKTRVYRFGDKTADGNSTMKNLLGGKGANLAEMSAIGIPVPPGLPLQLKFVQNTMNLEKMPSSN